MKRYNNGTADIFLYVFANICQAKVIVSHAGTDTCYTCYTIHFVKIKDHYPFLVFSDKQETTITKFNDNQVVEDEISQNRNTTDTEW